MRVRVRARVRACVRTCARVCVRACVFNAVVPRSLDAALLQDADSPWVRTNLTAAEDLPAKEAKKAEEEAAAAAVLAEAASGAKLGLDLRERVAAMSDAEWRAALQPGWLLDVYVRPARIWPVCCACVCVCVFVCACARACCVPKTDAPCRPVPKAAAPVAHLAAPRTFVTAATQLSTARALERAERVVVCVCTRERGASECADGTRAMRACVCFCLASFF
jgi:hypothetical protein